MLDERHNAAFVAEVVTLTRALVIDLDSQAGVQKRQLAETLRQDIKGKIDGTEDLAIGQKRNAGARAIGDSGLFQGCDGFSSAVDLAPNLSVPTNLEFETLGKCIDDGHSDSV